jgi:predicted TIM-barrel enzyme
MPPPRDRSDPASDIAAAILILAQSGHAGGIRVAEALAACRTGQGLMEALGAAPGYWQAHRLRKRDNAFRDLAMQLPSQKTRPLAVAALDVVTRYRASAAWECDQRAGHRPDGRNGLAFDILTSGAPLPDVEHLRKCVLRGIGV